MTEVKNDRKGLEGVPEAILPDLQMVIAAACNVSPNFTIFAQKKLREVARILTNPFPDGGPGSQEAADLAANSMPVAPILTSTKEGVAAVNVIKGNETALVAVDQLIAEAKANANFDWNSPEVVAKLKMCEEFGVVALFPDLNAKFLQMDMLVSRKTGTRGARRAIPLDAIEVIGSAGRVQHSPELWTIVAVRSPAIYSREFMVRKAKVLRT